MAANMVAHLIDGLCCLSTISPRWKFWIARLPYSDNQQASIKNKTSPEAKERTEMSKLKKEKKYIKNGISTNNER